MNEEHEATRDVREATRCPSVHGAVKCHMTVGHKGEHAGVAEGGRLISWPNDSEAANSQASADE